MKILVTGAGGQLGHDIVKTFKLNPNFSVKGIDIDDLDLTLEREVHDFLSSYQPDLIIHCAAWTDVDGAETNKESCYTVNVNTTKYLCNYCIEKNIRMVYFSTDYVFNGDFDFTHEYNEKSEVSPINYYGYTKHLGENEVKKVNRHLIFRISWVFGINGNNFVKTMIRLAIQKKEISIIGDQVGSPTYTVDLSKFLYEYLDILEYGTYNFTNTGFCTWYDFAKKVFELNKLDVCIKEIKSSEYKTAANRPLNSKLSKNKILDITKGIIPTWEDALKRYIIEIGEEK